MSIRGRGLVVLHYAGFLLCALLAVMPLVLTTARTVVDGDLNPLPIAVSLMALLFFGYAASHFVVVHSSTHLRLVAPLTGRRVRVEIVGFNLEDEWIRAVDHGGRSSSVARLVHLGVTSFPDHADRALRRLEGLADGARERTWSSERRA